MGKPKLVVYGAGDNAREFIYRYKNEALQKGYNLVGLIDDFSNKGFLDVNVIGNRNDLPRLKEEGIDNIIVFLLENPRKRLETCFELERMGFKFPSSKLRFNTGMELGKGVYVHDTATFLGIGNQKIGDFSIIGPYSTIEGDVEIGKGVILSPYVCLQKGAKIGDRTIFYTRSTCYPYVNVGENCIIGAHAIVNKFLKEGGKVKSPGGKMKNNKKK